jgi:hypothetical protein
VGARRAAAAASKLTANGTSAASQRDFILAYLVLGDFSTWNVPGVRGRSLAPVSTNRSSRSPQREREFCSRTMVARRVIGTGRCVETKILRTKAC